MTTPRRCDLSVEQSPGLDRDEQVKLVCKKLVEGWSDLDATVLKIEVLSGGITNTLLKVSKDENEIVVVRINGPNTDLFIDRGRELEARRYISEAGFGAALIGVYVNGYVESFINGRNLELEELSEPRIAALIAKEVRRFHDRVQVPGSREPQLWNDIMKFLDHAPNGPKYSVGALMEEVETLKNISGNLHTPVVFAHNDLLNGNLMLEHDTGKLYLLDFEYGSYNYRGFDIANHFNEYAGFECRFDLYPCEDQQEHFFRHYLHPEDPTKTSEAELETLGMEVRFYDLASHLYWGVWALLQAEISNINFDYMRYHSDRLHRYQAQKKQFMKTIVASVCEVPQPQQ